MMAASRRSIRFASKPFHRVHRGQELGRRRDDAVWIDRLRATQRNLIQSREDRSAVEVEPLEGGVRHPTLVLKERNRDVCRRDERRLTPDGDVVPGADDLAQPPCGFWKILRQGV